MESQPEYISPKEPAPTFSPRENLLLTKISKLIFFKVLPHYGTQTVTQCKIVARSAKSNAVYNRMQKNGNLFYCTIDKLIFSLLLLIDCWLIEKSSLLNRING